MTTFNSLSPPHPSIMPNDLRRLPTPRRTFMSLTPLRVFLLCFLSALYAILAIRFSLPPHNWIERYVHNRIGHDVNDKVLHHRPAFRGVERYALSLSLTDLSLPVEELITCWRTYRYSPEHKYRPATSPIVTQVGKDGKVTYKGKYH